MRWGIISKLSIDIILYDHSIQLIRTECFALILIWNSKLAYKRHLAIQKENFVLTEAWDPIAFISLMDESYFIVCAKQTKLRIYRQLNIRVLFLSLFPLGLSSIFIRNVISIVIFNIDQRFIIQFSKHASVAIDYIYILNWQRCQ